MAPNILTDFTTLTVFYCLFIISSSVIFINATGKYGRPGIHQGSTEKATHLHLDFLQHNGSSNSTVVCVAHANAMGFSSSPTVFDIVVVDNNALMEGPLELPISCASLLINFSATSNEATAAKASPLHHVSSYRCLESERAALLQFKARLHDPDGRLSSWQGLNCCRWAGVTCDYAVGSVIKVDLSGGMYMSGNLSGVIDPSLLQLKSLRHLDLSGNSFYQISIPDFIGSFKELRYLNLSNSGFTGNIPHQLGNLSSLRYLDLSLDGSGVGLLRVDSLQWVSGLSFLRHLALDGVNLLTVGSSWVHQLNERLPFLAELHLQDCNLDSIPPTLDYVNFTSLKVLDLSSNLFSMVPRWLSNISSLVHIDMSYNVDVNGAVPLGFSELPHLRYFDLSGNPDLTANMSELLGQAGWQRIQIFRMYSTNLYGEIFASIGKLCQLTELSLWGNNLTGELPPAIGQLSELTFLDLSYNWLTGVMTEAHFSSLHKLKELSLSDNSLVLNVSYDWIPPFQLNQLKMVSCQLGPAFPSWINSQRELKLLDLSSTGISDGPRFWNILPSNLQSLDLSGNNLTGGILISIEKLHNLQFLSLAGNNLMGGIPTSMMKLHKLFSLHLSANNLTGDIPEFIGQMNKLFWIDLSNNALSGCIPTSIGKLRHLLHLNLSANSLIGGIPMSMWRLSTLTEIDLSDNNLTGYIPMSIGEMDKLWHLSLSKNNLTGSIPTSIGKLQQLKILDLSTNKLIGTIPTTLFHCASLKVLKLGGNNLSGAIPKSIGRLQYLRLLDLSVNKLSGGIPTSLFNCSSLEFLNLGGNDLSGGILSSSRLGLMKDVKVLNFSDNRLSGKFPSFTRNLSSLKTLDLASNKLHGVIPTWIENIHNLTILRLRSNMFSGQIPSQLSKLKLLQVLDLAKNNLTGPIPQQLGVLSSMMHAAQQHSYFERSNNFAQYYAQTLVVHMKGLELELVIKTIFLLISMDLSDNQLSGRFPESLINLSGLVVLDLSGNFLIGTIPERIGNMHELESLDLSNNQFTGRIPPSMTSMSFLSFLNLSYNQLSGEIPVGGQLDTFNDASFLGNPDLCGRFLQRSCPRENQQHVGIDEDEEGIFEQDWFYLGLGLGFAFGLLAPFLILIIKRSWSEAYFRVVDQIFHGLSHQM